MHYQVLEDYLLKRLLEIQQPPEVQALQRYCKEIKRHKNKQWGVLYNTIRLRRNRYLSLRITNRSLVLKNEQITKLTFYQQPNSSFFFFFNPVTRCTGRLKPYLYEANLVCIAAETMSAAHEPIFTDQPMRVATYTTTTSKTKNHL